MSFESEKPFNDFQHFARGVRRSGDFTINESELLEKYGSAMMELYKGVRKPKTDEEKVFLEQLNGNEVITDRYARIFSKYLKVIAPAICNRLCSAGNEESSLAGQGSDDGTPIDE